MSETSSNIVMANEYIIIARALNQYKLYLQNLSPVELYILKCYFDACDMVNISNLFFIGPDKQLPIQLCVDKFLLEIITYMKNAIHRDQIIKFINVVFHKIY